MDSRQSGCINKASVYSIHFAFVTVDGVYASILTAVLHFVETCQACNERTSECSTNDRGSGRRGNRPDDFEEIHFLL